METFKSKEVEIKSPAFAVFSAFSDLTNLKDKLPDEFRDKVVVTADTVEGDYNGMHLGMKVAERIPTSKIVMRPMEGFPLDFSLIFDIADVSASSSRLNISIEAEMNFIMKAMLGGKIQSMLDQITEKLAEQNVNR